MANEQSPPTRGTLLGRLNNPRDRAAWDEFIQVYGSLVHNAVLRRGVGLPDADDVTQKVFIRLLRAMPAFQYQPSRGRFRDWLGAVVRGEVSRYWRGRDRNREQPTDPEELQDTLEVSEDAEWTEAFQRQVLAEALKRSEARFDPETWAAFVEVWVRQRSAEDVAAQFDRPVSWVYVAKSRGLKVLAKNLELLVELTPADQEPSDD